VVLVGRRGVPACSMTSGATMPSCRSPAIGAAVFQCPCGTEAARPGQTATPSETSDAHHRKPMNRISDVFRNPQSRCQRR
jgi:hypothetical protein